MHFDKPNIPEQLPHAEQSAREKANLDRFCERPIRASETLKPETKAYLEAYVTSHVGQWAQCDGEAVVFDGFSRDDAHGQILAWFVLEGHEVSDEILMPAWERNA
jgi:hypothetical protein